MMSRKVSQWYWIAMADQWGKYMRPEVTYSNWVLYALNDLKRSSWSQDMHIWAFGVEPERTCTSSYVKKSYRINVGTFLRILLQHFIAQKFVSKNLRRLFGLWSKNDPWRQTSPVKGVIVFKLALAVRKSNSDKLRPLGGGVKLRFFGA